MKLEDSVKGSFFFLCPVWNGLVTGSERIPTLMHKRDKTGLNSYAQTGQNRFERLYTNGTKWIPTLMHKRDI